MFAAFALAMISASLELVAGLGFPFAATASSLPSLVKTLPRAASALPFLPEYYAICYVLTLLFSPIQSDFY